MFGCSCPVIGQGAGDEIIAVFITIAMAVNIYIFTSYTYKSLAAFGEGYEYIIEDCINTSCLPFYINTTMSFTFVYRKANIILCDI